MIRLQTVIELTGQLHQANASPTPKATPCAVVGLQNKPRSILQEYPTGVSAPPRTEGGDGRCRSPRHQTCGRSASFISRAGFHSERQQLVEATYSIVAITDTQTISYVKNRRMPLQN